MPPTKPTLPVLEACAASRPTRNEPSCSLNTIDCTFGFSTTASMMANLVLGNSSATFFRAVSWLKPTATIGLEAVAGEAAQGLLALGVVLRFEIAVIDAGLLLELLGAAMDAFVEGLVELAAEVVDDRGLEGVLRAKRLSWRRRGPRARSRFSRLSSVMFPVWPGL